MGVDGPAMVACHPTVQLERYHWLVVIIGIVLRLGVPQDAPQGMIGMGLNQQCLLNAEHLKQERHYWPLLC